MKLVRRKFIQESTYLDFEKQRSMEVESTVISVIEAMYEKILVEGDTAVLEYAKTYDGYMGETLRVSKEEIEEAVRMTDDDFLRILNRAKEQITNFHQHQKEVSFEFEQDGIRLGQRITPLTSVAIYVPGGTAVYPSSVLMNTLPAKIAGVQRIVMLTPVGADGRVSSDILAAAAIAGVDEIYKVGGAHGVIAAALGTSMIPRVDKIVGPGNIYVAMAKKYMFGHVDIDMIAGPSEIVIIADEHANPAYIAADLMAQAEHDVMASSLLITPSKMLVARVEAELSLQIASLSRKSIIEESLQKYGGVILTNTLEEAVECSNRLAPEHLEILSDQSESILEQVKHAGSIFLGAYTPEVLGDYMGGPNHVLPTNGTARFSSPLGVYDFVKRSSYSYYPKEQFLNYAADVQTFAKREGLTAHAKAIAIRLPMEGEK